MIYGTRNYKVWLTQRSTPVVQKNPQNNNKNFELTYMEIQI